MILNRHLEEMPVQRIAYLRKTGPYGAGNRELMERLKTWAAENRLLDAAAVLLGIALDDPAKTPPESCRYDVGIGIGEEVSFPEGDIGTNMLPGGWYAVFTLDHTARAMEEAWATLFSELSVLGYRADAARPILERYPMDMVKNHLCQICVPILAAQGE